MLRRPGFSDANSQHLIQLSWNERQVCECMLVREAGTGHMFGEVLARHDNGQGVSMTSFGNEFRPTMQSDPLTYLKIPILPSTFATTPSPSCISEQIPKIQHPLLAALICLCCTVEPCCWAGIAKESAVML